MDRVPGRKNTYRGITEEGFGYGSIWSNQTPEFVDFRPVLEAVSSAVLPIRQTAHPCTASLKVIFGINPLLFLSSKKSAQIYVLYTVVISLKNSIIK